MRQLFYLLARSNGGLGMAQVALGLPPIVPNDQFPQIDFGFGANRRSGVTAHADLLNWDIQNLVTKVWRTHMMNPVESGSAACATGGSCHASGIRSSAGLNKHPSHSGGA